MPVAGVKGNGRPAGAKSGSRPGAWSSRWRSAAAGRGTGFGPWARRDPGNCRTSSSTARSLGRAGYGPARGRRTGSHRVGRGPVGGGGLSRHGPFARRDTLESQAFRRRRLNSTLKSLLFWMVLIVVGVLIWQFSTTFQRSENQIAFSPFLKNVDQGEVDGRHHHRQRDHRPALRRRPAATAEPSSAPTRPASTRGSPTSSRIATS